MLPDANVLVLELGIFYNLSKPFKFSGYNLNKMYCMWGDNSEASWPLIQLFVPWEYFVLWKILNGPAVFKNT